jgi:uncharacterized membrane protein YgcG
MMRPADDNRWWRLPTCFLLLVMGLVLVFPVPTRADEVRFGVRDVEYIEDFFVAIEIRPDATLAVTEFIRYDFGGTERHGIYRDIPIRYLGKSGVQQRLVVDIVSVTDEQGVGLPYAESAAGASLRVKVGDPTETVSGVHTYALAYTVRGALAYFDRYDELYWNVTGNNWTVPIERAGVSIVFPETVPIRERRVVCYRGEMGSTTPCVSQATWRDERDSKQHSTLTLYEASLFGSGEGLTVAVSFPKGLVREPWWIERGWWFFIENPLTLLPLAVFGSMGALWYRRGRDPEGRGTIIPEYDVPDELAFLEIAGLMKNRVGGEDIAAALVDLAVRGYLRIVRTAEKGIVLDQDDYTFYRLEKEAPAGSLDAALLGALFSGGVSLTERTLPGKLLSSPFVRFFRKGDGTVDEQRTENDYHPSIRLSELKHHFYQRIPALQDQALQNLVDRGYLAEHPHKKRLKYLAFGAATTFLFFFFGAVDGTLSWVSLGLAGLIYGVFAWLMPRVTREGALMKERILGLREYLRIAEKNRLEFHHAPEKSPALFEKLLPAALLLGVSDVWTKEFADISSVPPSWYSDTTGRAFALPTFSSDLNHFSQRASATLAAAPSGSATSGGGSSGGGFGGGGGGSW